MIINKLRQVYYVLLEYGIKILNYSKTNRKEIIHYCISGVLLTIVIPKTIDYGLKKYESHEVANRFIYEQGIKPYRNKLIECQLKNSELISKIGDQIGYWSLLTKLATNSSETYKEKALSKNNSDSIEQYLLKKAAKGSARIIMLEKQRDYCLQELILTSGEVAIILNVTPSYEKIYQQVRHIEKELIHERDMRLKSYMSEQGLPYLGVFRDIDLFNKYLIYFEKTRPYYKVLGFNIKMLDIIFDFNKKSYEAHSSFYGKTNQLFLSTYQRQLG